MVSGGTLLAFVLASLALIVIPGPSVLFVIGRSLSLGRRAGLLSVLGNEAGGIPLVFAVAFGIGTIVSASVVVFTIIKITGSLYLAFLGIQAIRHRKDHAVDPTKEPERPRTNARIFLQGAFVGMTNPKSIVFFVAVLPQFVNRAAGDIPLQLLLLGLIFLLLALLSDSVWAILAGSARNWFATSPKRMSTLSTVGGGMMIGLSGVLLLTGNKR
ncbi:MAG TPA: LysE family translocator [Galbitalea sp.]|jgi:threonine/homoserine/homoserine lactone efflux protein|nr:LysE family translocator [Galbitalea sp.]